MVTKVQINDEKNTKKFKKKIIFSMSQNFQKILSNNEISEEF